MATPSLMKWAEIDLGVIAGNAAWVKSQLPKGAGFVAAVKADAYGHGAVEVSRVVLKAGAEPWRARSRRGRGSPKCRD